MVPMVPVPVRFRGHPESLGRKFFGTIQMGAHKQGLKPQLSEKIGRNSALEKRAFSGLIGLSGPFQGRLGPIPPHLTATGEEQKLKLPRNGETALLAQLAPFGRSPRLLSPPFRPPWILLRPPHLFQQPPPTGAKNTEYRKCPPRVAFGAVSLRVYQAIRIANLAMSPHVQTALGSSVAQPPGQLRFTTALQPPVLHFS